MRKIAYIAKLAILKTPVRISIGLCLKVAVVLRIRVREGMGVVLVFE
jgi:hypothetical protein